MLGPQPIPRAAEEALVLEGFGLLSAPGSRFGHEASVVGRRRGQRRGILPERGRERSGGGGGIDRVGASRGAKLVGERAAGVRGGGVRTW